MRFSINVDMDVYKALAERGKSDGVDQNAILRQLLDLGREPTSDFWVTPPLDGEAARNAVAGSQGPSGRPRSAPSNGVRGPRRIAVVGATGSIGGRVVSEALSRDAEVVAVVRDPSKLAPRAGVTVRGANANDPQGLAGALAGADAVVVSVKWAEADINPLLAGLRASGVKRAIFVIGCGSLVRHDGRRHFVHVAEANGVPPPETVPAVRVLDALKAVEGLEWTVISCPIDIRAGERTGQFRTGGDQMLFDDHGVSRISEEDFAVAIIDEIREPAHVREQFGAAY